MWLDVRAPDIHDWRTLREHAAVVRGLAKGGRVFPEGSELSLQFGKHSDDVGSRVVTNRIKKNLLLGFVRTYVHMYA